VLHPLWGRRFRLPLLRTGNRELDTPVVVPPPPQHDGIAGNLASALYAAPDKRSAEQKKLVLDYFEYSNPQLQPARIELAKLEAQSAILTSQVPE